MLIRFPPEPEEPDEEEEPDVLEEDLLDELLEAVSFFAPPGVLEEYVPVTTLPIPLRILSYSASFVSYSLIFALYSACNFCPFTTSPVIYALSIFLLYIESRLAFASLTAASSASILALARSLYASAFNLTAPVSWSIIRHAS